VIRFRPASGPVEPPTNVASASQLAQIIGDVLRPCHFLTPAHSPLTCTGPQLEEIAWEIFRGRLLDAAQTREVHTFTTWNVFAPSTWLGHPAYTTPGSAPDEPLLSVKLDERRGEIHVVRAILCHVWEAHGDRVIESREVVKWVRELVGTIAWQTFRSEDSLRDELICLLFHAIVGTSRLPLHSLEAPLPCFSLGQLAYFYRPEASAPLTGWSEWIDNGLGPELARVERAKFLEFLLRAVSASELEAAAERFAARWQAVGQTAKDLLALLRTVFTEVSLSPYTDFVDNTLEFLRSLVTKGYLSVEEQADFLGLLLRQTCRHLTAYDLVTFHYRGANYPDALLLDAVLTELLSLNVRHPHLFCAEGDKPRLRRRALRQACLLWRFYQGHQVPDVPTSPGENARVLPAPYVRVPEDQLVQATTRRRRLFAAETLHDVLGAEGRSLLQQASDDLHHPEELRELGVAVFIDRPLGLMKKPAEPDQTPLLAHEAFSRDIAVQRVHDLARLATELGLRLERDAAVQALQDLHIAGLPVTEIAAPDRPTVSLADALRVSPDFLVLRTLPVGLEVLRRLYDWTTLTLPERNLVVACVPSAGETVLAVFDDRYRKRVEFAVDATAGYQTRAGIEFPKPGLRVLRLWREVGNEVQGFTPENVLFPSTDE
jgi:hypothetical protein